MARISNTDTLKFQSVCNFMLQFQIYGLGFHRIVVGINGMEKGGSLFGAGDSGTGELAPLTVHATEKQI